MWLEIHVFCLHSVCIYWSSHIASADLDHLTPPTPIWRGRLYHEIPIFWSLWMFKVTFLRIHPKMRMHRGPIRPRWPWTHDTNWHVNKLHPTTSRELWSPDSVRILRQRCWKVSIATLNKGNLASSCTMTCPQLTQRIETVWRIMVKAVSLPLPFVKWEWLGCGLDTTELREKKYHSMWRHFWKARELRFSHSKLVNIFDEMHNVCRFPGAHCTTRPVGKGIPWKMRLFSSASWHEVRYFNSPRFHDTCIVQVMFNQYLWSWNWKIR